MYTSIGQPGPIALAGEILTVQIYWTALLAYTAQALVKNLVRPALAMLSLAGCTQLEMEPCSMEFCIKSRNCCTCRRAVDECRHGGLHSGVHSLCACGQDD